MEHEFTQEILKILSRYFGRVAEDIFGKSSLIQYLNIKSRSVSRGSKARGSFGNIYAIYVIVEDYVQHGFDETGDYSSYEGAKFSSLMARQRLLPFGSKLQNHALNHRLNQEFRKYFAQVSSIPILRDPETNRYWFNENLLKVRIGQIDYNIAAAVIDIVDKYVAMKRRAFKNFIDTCEGLKRIGEKGEKDVEQFILSLLAPNIDARLFEIVSYAILKFYYRDQTVYFGFDWESIEETPLALFKTGRTNANDGGIDFVMRPLGRFFQVTETLDVKKYFLDIDKIERFPISFVIKSEEPTEVLADRLRRGAEKQYLIKAIVERYMSCIEEIINIGVLRARFKEAMASGYTAEILDEVVRQSRIEFNDFQ